MLHTQRDHRQQLSCLYRIAKLIGQQQGHRVMLQSVLDCLEEGLGMHRGTVMLTTQDGSELTVEATRDLDQVNQNVPRYRRGEGITGQVLQTGQAAIIPNIVEEPGFQGRIHRRQAPLDHRISFICVPISFENEVVGTLAVDMHCHDDEELQEAKQLLSMVSVMIANDVKSRRSAQLQRQKLEDENIRLRRELGEIYRPENIIGNSHAMQRIYDNIRKVAGTDTTVLIRGESGTGKELVASAIHYGGPRKDRPFVKVNCAALTETLLESELFGHEKGAFTGAVQTRIGRIEEADGGTLFLDEVGEFSQSVQVKLLRVLQEREFERVGSNQTRKSNIRIVAATNRNLEEAVESGKFRQDLYYRINVFSIYLPPLSERRGDILLLADHFVEKYAQRMNKEVRRISTAAINMMLSYHWPGNVRELENCIEHAVLLSTDDVIHGYNLPPTLQTPSIQGNEPVSSLKTCIAQLERDMIIDALKRNDGRINNAADDLGITSRMVRYKIEKLNIHYRELFKKKH